MKELLRKLESDGIKKVKLGVNKQQEPAVGLYQGFGFKIVGEEKQRVGTGKLVDEYLMEKLFT